MRTDFDEWVFLFANRKEMSVAYAAVLRMAGTGWDQWGEVNAAIVNRWSESGLEYIKRRAWKLAGAAS